MKLGIVKERISGENRVAASPETVKKYISLGFSVAVEKGAGLASSISDKEFEAAGAAISSDISEVISDADIVLKVQPPFLPEEDAVEVDGMKRGGFLVSLLNPYDNKTGIAALAKHEINAFGMELIPRISRAQNMDVLSSQSNLAGYKAVIDAVAEFGKAVPMMMTAAGTVKPAKILILGAGVAGLQAIATAKRLGAVIEASDVRPAAKEQIESLGAKFIDVPFETDEEREIAQGVGGYARPMPATWMQRQAHLVAERAKQADIVITTALIPGRPAPMLLSAETVAQMKPGSVVVDLAAGKGINGSGNCPLTEANQIVVKHGVTIIGMSNLPALLAADASALYAR
ncbi:MAG: Re/Si-specific NAD(P)(+) transhydrogenase subunit alpha, partial [Proteobacteria bacterium]|nr:Re/Si-specific NAD(P)(+) transhydrogenase subunit alpha [Pseudomonadota bacterium]